MHLQILAVRDRQLDGFMQPFTAQSVGAGVRAFGDMVNDDQSQPYKHPEDYELYHVGTFDPNTGELTPIKPKQVALGTNYRQK